MRTSTSFRCYLLYMMVIRAVCCYVFTLHVVICLFVSEGFQYTCLVNACRHARRSCAVCRSLVFVFSLVVHDPTRMHVRQ